MGGRIGWLDTARAIGIVAVVIGHVTSDPVIRAAMYHFHMPLFFMLSGMVFTPAAASDVVRRRGRSLLIPYVAWLLLLIVADVLIAKMTGHATYLPWDRPIAAVARAILGGTYLVGSFGVFWFVTCLFIVQIAANVILHWGDRAVVVAAVALFVMAHLMLHWPSPWGVISVPLSLFFFLAGILYRRHEVMLGKKALILSIGAALPAMASAPPDLKIADYGTPVISIVGALGMCHLIFIIARRAPASALFTSLGQASIVIMYLHLTIFYALRDRVPEALIILLATAIPVVVWIVLRQHRWTRALLLGDGFERGVATRLSQKQPATP